MVFFLIININIRRHFTERFLLIYRVMLLSKNKCGRRISHTRLLHNQRYGQGVATWRSNGEGWGIRSVYTNTYIWHVCIYAAVVIYVCACVPIVYNTPLSCPLLFPPAVLLLAHPSPLASLPIFPPGTPPYIPATLPGVT